MRAAHPDARASSCRWPTRPNPVTSVTAWGPTARSASAASRLSVVIEATAAASTSSRHGVVAQGVGDDARAQRLRQHEHVARPSAGVRPDLVRRRRAGDDQPVLRLGVDDGVPADDHDAGVGRRQRAALHDGRRDLAVEVGREPRHGEREQRPRAHGVHVRDRVGRRDAAEVEGVVDDGREEVDALYEHEVVAQPDDGGVVERAGADQHARIVDRWQTAQHLRQLLGGELGCSTTARGHPRQAHAGRVGHGFVRVSSSTPTPGQRPAVQTR